MRADADGFPAIGREFSMLGVRIAGDRLDVRVLDDGTIQAEAGGMSVFINPRRMPKSLRPRMLLGRPGESPHPCFKMEERQLPPELVFRRDKEHHGLVEPRQQCKFEEYEAHLHGTRSQWRVAYAAPK
ncbi:MAG TPA: hypothetical protein VNO30_11720 [Kofleriaceae bacterium]|nr:hypothetical protein [Kofleriaceae bacterium]